MWILWSILRALLLAWPVILAELRPVHIPGSKEGMPMMGRLGHLAHLFHLLEEALPYAALAGGRAVRHERPRLLVLIDDLQSAGKLVSTDAWR